MAALLLLLLPFSSGSSGPPSTPEPAADLTPITATTAAQIAALLSAPDLLIDFGADLLDANEDFLLDISADLQDAEITRNMYRALHGTAKFTVARQLVWQSQRIRPWISITSSTQRLTQTWAFGVWALTTPERDISESPETFVVAALDKLSLVDQPIPAAFVTDVDDTYVGAVERILADKIGETNVRIDQSKVDVVIPAQRTYLADGKVTWLSIVNELLAALNYEGLWSDRDGAYRSRLYLDPASRSRTFDFSATDKATVGDVRKLTTDLDSIPNVWVFVRKGASTGLPVDGAGRYEVTNQSDGPTSVDARGRSVVTFVELDVPDDDALVAAGNSQVTTDKQATTKVALTTVPAPLLWHLDTVGLTDPAIGSFGAWAVEEWTQNLTGTDMAHTWRQL
jgi:hypothetical protein